MHKGLTVFIPERPPSPPPTAPSVPQEFEADGYALLDLLLNRFRLREWYVQDAAPELTAGERSARGGGG